MIVFSLCDLLTRPHTRPHTLVQHARHVFFKLAYCDDCMTHCRIPHGFAGWVLAAHQTLFFHHSLTFARHQKHLLSPVYWRKSCGFKDLVWVMFRRWLRQSNMYHSLCRSDRVCCGEMQGGMVADLTRLFFNWLHATGSRYICTDLCVVEAEIQWCMDVCYTSYPRTT